MGNTIPEIAASCVFAKVRPSVGVTAGAHQFDVNAKGGCDMIQWISQIIMEVEPDPTRACLDANNAFGNLERPCIRAALEADVALHPIIPLYDVFYSRGKGELWYYDEMGNFVMSVLCRKGVRHGCVLCMTIMCIIVRHVFDALLEILGPEGCLFNYADDVYLGGVHWNVALALDAASVLYAMIGLSLGWGPRKTELQLLVECEHDHLPLPRDKSGRPLPEVVNGFRACLGVPWHPTNCDMRITEAMLPLAK
jgi:hypothetical protein